MKITEETREKILKVLKLLDKPENEIVISTHNDPDAVGSMININYYMPNCKKKFFHTSYRDLDEFTHNTIDYIQKHNVKVLFITDVSFSQNRNLVQQLDDTAHSLGILTIYIDHHMYPDNYFDGFNMYVSHNTTKSATQLTHEFFNNHGKSKKLDDLTRLIDVYDIWQNKEKEFRLSMIFNEYFWSVGMDEMFYKLVENDYGIPTDFSAYAQKHLVDSRNEINAYRNRNLIHCDGITTLAFVDHYFNDILYEEFNKGIKIILIVNSYGIIRMRFNGDSDLSDEVKISIKQDILGTENIGHLNAFAFKLDSVSFEKIMERIKEVNAIISKNLNKN